MVRTGPIFVKNNAKPETKIELLRILCIKILKSVEAHIAWNCFDPEVYLSKVQPAHRDPYKCGRAIEE